MPVRPTVLALLVPVLLLTGACSAPGPQPAPPRVAEASDEAPPPTDGPAGPGATTADAASYPRSWPVPLRGGPGAFSGDAFDVEAAAAAVAASGSPQDGDGWAAAVLEQVRGDHAEAVRTLLDAQVDGAVLPAHPGARPAPGTPAPRPPHVAIVLDASGSMAARAAPGMTRMDQAKAAIRSFGSSLPPGTSVSLRVYGQVDSAAGVSRAEACRATSLLHSGDPRGLGASMAPVRPTGWTPLGLAVTAAAADVPRDASRTVVYVVTDGLETCGGRPVAATRRLARTGVHLVVDVVGFHTGTAQTARLRAMATAGGGRFTAVESQVELERFWARDVERMRAAWSRWQERSRVRVARHLRATAVELRTAAAEILRVSRTETEQAGAVLDALERVGATDPVTASRARSVLSLRLVEIRAWTRQQRWAQLQQTRLRALDDIQRSGRLAHRRRVDLAAGTREPRRSRQPWAMSTKRE